MNSYHSTKPHSNIKFEKLTKKFVKWIFKRFLREKKSENRDLIRKYQYGSVTKKNWKLYTVMNVQSTWCPVKKRSLIFLKLTVEAHLTAIESLMLELEKKMIFAENGELIFVKIALISKFYICM